jgi:hypothetical protein
MTWEDNSKSDGLGLCLSSLCGGDCCFLLFGFVFFFLSFRPKKSKKGKPMMSIDTYIDNEGR